MYSILSRKQIEIYTLASVEHTRNNVSSMNEQSYVPLTTNNFEIRIYGNGSNTPAENSNLLTLATAEIGEIEEDQDKFSLRIAK